MYATTARFIDSIGTSVRSKTVVDIYYDGVLVLSDVPVSSGSITQDRASDSRVSGQLQVAGVDFDWTSLEPWGTELIIKSGFVYPDNTQELVPMGVFRIEDDSWSEGVAVAPTINFFDRSRFLMDTYIMHDIDHSGQTYTEVWNIIANYSIPDVTISIDPDVAGTTRLPGGSVFMNQTNWDLVKELAVAVGAECFFNRDGEFVVAPAPSITSATNETDAVWTIGVETNLISANRVLTREGAANGVGVSGATSDTGVQVFAMVFDEAPQSKSNYFGPFGRKTQRFENSTITTNAQAVHAARNLLKEKVGLTQTVRFECIANPALDVGDIVIFDFFDDTEIHMIQTLTMNIGEGKMSGTTKTIQYVTE